MTTEPGSPSDKALQNVVQEIQTWMPNGDEGNDNFLTLQEYTDSPIRQDGALPNSIAEPKSYNKVLHQVTKVVVGLALYLNAQGVSVTDDSTADVIKEGIIKAVETNIKELLDPSSGVGGVKRDVTYEQKQTILETNAPQGAPIQVLPYDVGRTSMLVFLDGILIPKGSILDEANTDSWHEVGTPGTAGDTIKFKCSLPKGGTLSVIRFGDLRYTA